MEQILTSYGYLGILIGTFLEGETVLILGGFCAHRGYLELPWVIAAAFAGTLGGDQLFFFLGRSKGIAFLEKRHGWKTKAEKIFSLLQTHQLAVMLGFRFLYGLRSVAPFIVGASGLKPVRFFILNTLGAAIWSVTIGSLGYLFGHFLELILEEIHKYEIWVIIFISAVGAVLWGRYWLAHVSKKPT